MRIISKLLLLIVVTTTGCTGVFFQPMRQLVASPADYAINYHEIWITSADNQRLHGWKLLPESSPRGTILFIHGNAENISTHMHSVLWLVKSGFQIILFDYRGYGLSPGSPTLHGAHLDAAAAIEYALDNLQTPKLTVFGQSLGAAISISAVARHPRKNEVDALIVESGFTSYRAIAREKLAQFWLTWLLQIPLSWTIDTSFSPIDEIAELPKLDLLIIAGEDDQVTPVSHGLALYAKAKQPKTLWITKKVAHIATFNSPEYQQRLLNWLD